MKAKEFTGNDPSGNLYFKVGTITFNGDWIVYAVKKNNNSSWVNLKIIFDGKRTNKANFWLGYNLEEKKFSNNSCSKVLLKNYKDFASKITEFIENDLIVLI